LTGLTALHKDIDYILTAMLKGEIQEHLSLLSDKAKSAIEAQYSSIHSLIMSSIESKLKATPEINVRYILLTNEVVAELAKRLGAVINMLFEFDGNQPQNSEDAEKAVADIIDEILARYDVYAAVPTEAKQMTKRILTQIKQSLSRSQNNTDRITATLRSVLSTARLDAGKVVLSPSSINIAEWVDELHQRFAAEVIQKGLEFKIEVSPHVPSMIFQDKDALNLPVNNLIVNALKFTQKGGITISLDAHDGQLFIKVRDTGTGIPQDKLTDIFKQFVQVDQSTTRQHHGTGLGLAIVSGYVNLAGGGYEVESELGVGSTFTIHVALDLGATN
jgi:signal transduction histidine kinase